MEQGDRDATSFVGLCASIQEECPVFDEVARDIEDLFELFGHSRGEKESVVDVVDFRRAELKLGGWRRG